MAADLVVAAADVAVVEEIQKLTGPAAGVIPAGTPVYLDATTGHFTAGDASAAGTAGIVGVAIDSATIALQTISVLRKGLMDLGGALDALAFGDPVPVRHGRDDGRHRRNGNGRDWNGRADIRQYHAGASIEN